MLEEYRNIITKHYNKTNMHFSSEEEYEKLYDGWLAGDENATKEFLGKVYFYGFDHVGELFTDGKLTGNFEDALQQTYVLIHHRKDLIPDTFIEFKFNIDNYLDSSFEALQADEKEKNAYLNFDKFVNADEIADDTYNPQQYSTDEDDMELDR